MSTDFDESNDFIDGQGRLHPSCNTIAFWQKFKDGKFHHVAIVSREGLVDVYMDGELIE